MKHYRAGHATTMPPQQDHVFRPKSGWLLHYDYIHCGYSIYSRHRRLYTFFLYFFLSLKLYYVVVVATQTMVTCPALWSKDVSKCRPFLVERRWPAHSLLTRATALTPSALCTKNKILNVVVVYMSSYKKIKRIN